MELIQTEEAEVKPLFEKTSKWDVKFRGNNIIRLEILDTENAQWVQEVKVKDVVYPFMLKFLPPEELEKPTTKVLAHWNWRPRWFDRFIFRTKEKSLFRWVNKNHKLLLNMQKEAMEEPDRLEKIRKELEIK